MAKAEASVEKLVRMIERGKLRLSEMQYEQIVLYINCHLLAYSTNHLQF